MYIFIYFGGRIQLVSVVGFDEICQRPWNQQSHTVSFDSQSDLESAATRTARRSYTELEIWKCGQTALRSSHSCEASHACAENMKQQAKVSKTNK